MQHQQLDIESEADYLAKSLLLLLYSGLLLVPALFIFFSFGVTSISSSIIAIPHLLLLAAAIYFATKALFRDIFLKSSLFGQSAIVLGYLVLASLITIVMLPTTSRDALIHHLAVPKWWIERGELIEIEWHPWSNYPMLLQSSYIWLLKMNLERLCAFYHFTYLVLLASYSALISNNLSTKKNYSALCFLCCASLPIFQKMAGEPLVDLGMACFALASLFWGFQLLNEPNNREHWFKFSAMLGLCASCKPNGVVFCAVAFLSLFALLLKDNNVKIPPIKHCLLGLIVTLSIYAPWAIRNTELTGNPFYPFGGDPRRKQAQIVPHPSLSNFQIRLQLYQESALDIAMIPLRIFGAGEDDNPKKFDGVLTPLLALGLLPFFGKTKRREKRLLYLSSIIYFAISVFYAPIRIRYLSPILASLLILALNLISRASQIWAPAIWLSIHLAISLKYLYSRISEVPSKVLLDYSSYKEGYLNSKIPEWPVINYINKNLAPDSKIYLVLTGNKFFYYQRQVITSGHQTEELLASIVYYSSASDQIRDKLKKLGITHIMAHNKRTTTSLESLLPQEKRELLSRFMQEHLVAIYSANGFGLWQIN